MEGKVLGVIGGMGPLATELFYHMITEKTEAEKDQQHIDMIILSHASMPDRTAALLSGDKDDLIEKLKEDVLFLQNADVAAVAMPCNTVHKLLDDLKEDESIRLPFLDMIELASQKLIDDGAGRVGIMATDGAVETGIYQEALAKHGIEATIPEEDVQREVMYLIYDCIKKNKPADMDSMRRVEEYFRKQGCDRVLLGCTELSVIKRDEALGEYFMDAMEILAEEAVRFCKS